MSSSISSIDPAQTAAVAKHHHHHHGHAPKDVLDSVGKALGMDADDVKTAVQNGTSLTALAAQKGVSEDTLLGAIKDGLTKAGNGQGPAGAQLDRIAQRIADRVPGGAPQPEPPSSSTTSGLVDVQA